MTKNEIEAAARQFRLDILSLAARQGTPINVVVLALADVLTDIAVQSDLTEGRMTLQDRLDAFTKRFEETYEMVRTLRESPLRIGAG